MDPAPDTPSVDRLVRALALTTLLLWVGASCILPLLPEYLRDRGGSDATVGLVMAAYFVAALLFQYPAGRLADRFGRRPVLLAGLAVYAAGSLGFLAGPAPAVDIVLRGLQGAGAGSAEVAALAMISGAVHLERRGRAFGSIYAAQLGGMAVGPLFGSLVGVGSMAVLFVAAGVAALVACLPALVGPSVAGHDDLAPAAAPAAGAAAGAAADGAAAAADGATADGAADSAAAVVVGHSHGLPALNRSLVGAVLAAAAFGLTIGVYESCWTLLLDLRHAQDWQIGLSWTLFAVPFVVMARPGGWLADHLDRRWLAVGALSVSVGLCALYPFLHSLTWLLLLGGLEALATAVSLPAAQSMLTQWSPASEAGRVQGLFSTAETGAIAVAAAAGGALFGLAAWAPFVAAAAGAAVLTAAVPFVWAPVAGRAAAAHLSVSRPGRPPVGSPGTAPPDPAGAR
ncbi:MAG TPA: MFS transporter [Acidimicrobiales bacterium]|nr:MFS transporter [Acidimicrobiales bacterium]